MTVYDHPEYLSLLASVREKPDDDAPRLVIADWLQEHGEGDRAEFIRVQCELEGIVEKVKRKEATDPAHLERLIRRERELIANVTNGFPENWQWSAGVAFPQDAPAGQYMRGFVFAVTCTAADWLAHAAALTAAHPVQAVTLTTRPEMRHHSGDVIPNPDTADVLATLARRWPGITFTLPCDADAIPDTLTATYTTAHSGLTFPVAGGNGTLVMPDGTTLVVNDWQMEESRIADGDPDVARPLGTMTVKAPKVTATRNTRRPSWLTPARPTRPR